VAVASLFTSAPRSDLFTPDAYQGFVRTLNVARTVLGFVSSQNPEVTCVYVGTDNAQNFSGYVYVVKP
jgi:hypothetical protein